MGFLTTTLLAAALVSYVSICVWRYAEMLRFRTRVGAELRAYLARTDSGPVCAGTDRSRGSQAGPERGIAICAGGRALLSQAYLALDALRNLHGSQLPVELVHSGEHELPPACREFFERSFAPLVCVDLQRTPLPPGDERLRGAGFAIKPFALLASSFPEILLLDADCVPLRDPAPLFDAPRYRASGNLFWSDSWLLSVQVDHPHPLRIFALRDGVDRRSAQSLNPRIFDLLELPRPATRERVSYETEAGQLLVDRARVQRALRGACFLNARARWLYRYLHGDKDSYRLGFAAAGLPFEQIQQPPAHAGVLLRGRFLGRAFLQPLPGGEPGFLHQVGRKPHVDRPWIPLTHATRAAAADHPRRRAERGCTLSAPVAALPDLACLDPEVEKLEQFLARSHRELVTRAAEIGLPPPPRRPLVSRRLLPW